MMPSSHTLDQQTPAFRFRYLTETTFLLTILFVVLPLIDMVNGLFILRGVIGEGSIGSPSQLGRLGAEVLCFIYCLNRGKVFAPLLIMFWFVFIELVAAARFGNGYGLLFGLVQLNKLVYLVLVIQVLSMVAAENPGRLGVFIISNLWLTAGSLVFAQLSGTGFSTYGWGFGTKGYFASGNAVGIYIGAMSLLVMASKSYFRVPYSGLLIPFAMVALLVVGTKASALLFAIVAVSWLLGPSSNRTFKWLRIVTLACVVGFVFPIALGLLESMFEVVLARFGTSEGILGFLTSGRLVYVEDAIGTFLLPGLDPWRLILGSGAFTSFQVPMNVAVFDVLETDFFDVAFMYGAVGLTIYAVFWLGALSLAVSRIGLFIPLALLCAHSLVAGHTIFNGMIALPIATGIALSSVPYKNSAAETK